MHFTRIFITRIEDEEDNRWGYVRTKTPFMAKSDLYKISGHWDHYKEGMFVLGGYFSLLFLSHFDRR